MFPKSKRKTDRAYLDYIKTLPCVICGRRPTDPSHIRTRKSGGSDLPHNVFPKCRKHHVEFGQIGNTRFLEKYPEFAIRLKNVGWILLSTGKLFHEDET